MTVVDFPHMAPSVCFICEGANPVPHYDTNRHFEPGGVTHLDGRKYLCEWCVRDAADALGILDVRADPIREELTAERERNDTLETRLAALKAIEESVAVLIAKPKRTKAAKPAVEEE